MGMFDSVMVPCPKCGELVEFQSKSGPCMCRTFTLDTVPPEILVGAYKDSPSKCRCGEVVHLPTFKHTIVTTEEPVKWEYSTIRGVPKEYIDYFVRQGLADGGELVSVLSDVVSGHAILVIKKQV
jgi:hypothetical protein